MTQFLNTKKQIKAWLDKSGVKNYQIIDDNGQLVVNCEGEVYLSGQGLKELPVKFGTVEGTFCMNDNFMQNLMGCPAIVGGDFLVEDNQLTSLKGCPKIVGKAVYLAYNKLSTIDDFPEKIGKFINVSSNPGLEENQKMYQDPWELWQIYNIIVEKQLLEKNIGKDGELGAERESIYKI